MSVDNKFFKISSEKSSCEDGSLCFYLPGYSKFNAVNEYIDENNLSSEEISSILLYYNYIIWNFGILVDNVITHDFMEKRTDKEIPENTNLHLEKIIQKNNQKFSDYFSQLMLFNDARSKSLDNIPYWQFETPERELFLITQGELDIHYDDDANPQNTLATAFNSGTWLTPQNFFIPNRKLHAYANGHYSIFRMLLVGSHKLSDYNIQVIKLSEGETESVSRPISKNTRVYATTIRQVAPTCIINSVDYTHEPFVPELTFSPGETLEVSLTSVNNVKNSIFLVFVEEKQ